MHLLIADSQSLARLGLKALLEQHPLIDRIFEAEDEVVMKSMLESGSVDVMMIDFSSEGFSIDSVVKAKALRKQLQCVAITPEQSAFTIANAVRAGIQSYVKKDCSLEEIVGAVIDSYSGERFFCGQILETIRRESISVSELESEALSCEPVVISERESEIIALIAEGYTNGQIAEKLYLSGHTIGTHRKNIMQKLGVNNTAAVVMYAVKTGLVNPNRFLFSGKTA